MHDELEGGNASGEAREELGSEGEEVREILELAHRELGKGGGETGHRRGHDLGDDGQLVPHLRLDVLFRLQQVIAKRQHRLGEERGEFRNKCTRYKYEIRVEKERANARQHTGFDNALVVTVEQWFITCTNVCFQEKLCFFFYLENSNILQIPF